jgi:carboxyl-terminal processing protease
MTLRSRSPVATFAAISGLGVLVGLLLHPIVRARTPAPSASIEMLERIHDLVREKYVEDVDSKTLYEGALRGMLAALDDYSEYYSAEDRPYLDEETTGEFGGLGFYVDREAPPITVEAVMPGHGADRAGLLAGDRIVVVDGVAVDARLDRAGVERIRGKVGTTVRLSVLRGGASDPLELVAERERIPKPSVIGARIADESAGIGYLRIASFQERTLAEFDDAVARLRADGASALVLDLRGNDGGLFDPARDIANRFVASGVLVSTVGRISQANQDYAAEEAKATLRDLPLAVLVDGASASASEVLAGALRDHGRAALVGQRTFGKGLIQSIFQLDDAGVTVKFTTAQYVTPGGQHLERPLRSEGENLPALGLEPDLQVSTTHEEDALLYRGFDDDEIRQVVPTWTPESVPFDDRALETAVAFLRGEPYLRVLDEAPPAAPTATAATQGAENGDDGTPSAGSEGGP